MDVERSRAGLAAALAAGALVFGTGTAALPAAAASQDPEHQLDELNETIQEYAANQLDAHADAVQDALGALERAEAELEAATVAAQEAIATAGAARHAADQAAQALEAARRAERQESRKLTELTVRLSETRDRLGAVARAAYQSGGGLAGWSTLLEPDNPANDADRNQGARNIFRAGDQVLHELAAAQAELVATQDYVRGLRTEHQQLVERAAETLAAAATAEDAALAAERDLAEKETAHSEALAAAESARDREYDMYQEFLAESDALEAWLAEYSIADKLEGTGTFVRPGTGGVTSSFGPRMHPILGYVKTHTGVDLGLGDGFIYAADHGVVAEATWNDAYGYLVIVDHGVIDGKQVSTLYAHQPGLSVDVGDKVAKGQPIGSVGSTGFSTGPHLHFEVRIGGRPVNPWPWISDAPLPADVTR